jgi:hypothetical protein
MPRPRRLPGQIEPVQQLAQSALVVGDPEALPHDPAEVDQPPSRDAIDLGIGTRQYDRLQRRLLAFCQPAWPAITPVVRQPSRPATIVADHPIAQRLPVHACDARGGLPAQPIQRGGDRQQAPGDPRVALDLGQPTQFYRGDVLADQKGGHGRPLDAMHADESRPPASAQAKESALQPVGMIPPALSDDRSPIA